MKVTAARGVRPNIDFPAWTGPRRVELEFRRDARGAVAGFALSAGQARDIEFVRLPGQAP